MAKCGTTGIRHNPALPAPRASQCFHEWSHFPDSGLAEPPAARPNHHQPPPGLRVGPEQFCSCEWQRALPPQGEEEGERGFIFIFIFKFPALFLRKGIVSFRILAAVPDNSCGLACGRRDWRLRSSVWKSACCFRLHFFFPCISDWLQIPGPFAGCAAEPQTMSWGRWVCFGLG